MLLELTVKKSVDIQYEHWKIAVAYNYRIDHYVKCHYFDVDELHYL